ncbi:MAG: hypothetical protein KJO04_03540, partial [Bacteroidia bacterium]|nr:hypothetical protein [Bacteroidia bacterium]
MSQFEKYWKELQRRHVVKAGIAYLAIAWVITEVATAVLPLFKIPEVFLKWLVVLLAVGFPIWLILAWVYDFSWGSIQKTEDVPFDAEVSRKKNLGLNRVIIGGLAIAVILLLVNTFRLSDKVDTLEDEFLAMNFTNSLAILPFEDLSPKQDQRYFSDGLARSIYSRLARSKNLKLISPTSSFQYRDKEVSIEVIAEELDVSYVLEGSVQLFDNRYRASINLVDSQEGTTIWSKTFDDSLENVLNTYDEVAENVGAFLDITLTSTDVRKKKVDPEAYLLYLKADELLTKEAFSKNSVITADSLIKRSLVIDADYSPSQSKLAQTTFHKTIYWGLLERPLGLAIAKEAAYKAIDLDPEDPWGYIWISNLSWHDRDFSTYQEFLDKSIEKGQNHPDVAMYQGWCYRRTNRVEDAYFYDKKAAILDPKNNEYNAQMANHEMYRGTPEEATRWLNNMNSEWLEWKTLDLAMLKIFRGDFQGAEIAISSLPPYLKDYAHIQLLVKNRKLEQAQLELQGFIGFDKKDSNYLNYAATEYVHYWWIADLYSVLGDKDKAFSYLNQAYPEIKDYIESFFMDYDLIPLHDDP